MLFYYNILHEIRTHLKSSQRRRKNHQRRACCASIYWNILHIELVWVSEEARGKNIGSQMVEKAEAFAIEKGSERALLDTTTWQARPFYEKLGYEVFGTLPDHPKGHALHFMTKKLVEETD